MDGITGGVQKRLKVDMSRIGMAPKPYDFMLFTNMSMCAVALVISLALGEVMTGYKFCMDNPAVLNLVVHFSICSAVGQSFIFYTVAHFDPLVCSTVTTTRKIFSVLLSIFTKGHAMSGQGWTGVSIAVGGIVSEVHAKITKSRRLKSKVSM
jgi:UDP-galactose transporter B1